MEEMKQLLVDVKKEQALLSSKVTLLMRASGLDGSQDALSDEIKFPVSSSTELFVLEKRLDDSQLARLLVSYLSLNIFEQCLFICLGHVLLCSIYVSDSLYLSLISVLHFVVVCPSHCL
jgi:hypothetical protein